MASHRQALRAPTSMVKKASGVLAVADVSCRLDLTDGSLPDA
jgi:hypothetical protein